MAIETLERELIELSRGYHPNEAVAADIRPKFIVAIAGPAAVGKTTVVEMACKDNPEFSRVRSITTRAQRANESNEDYFFEAHTEASLKAIAAKARARSLVQFTMHPTTNRFYGSEVSSYPNRYNLLTALSGDIPKLRQLPFAHCVTIGLAMQPSLWSKLFLERHAQLQDIDDSLARLEEARISLEWGLDDAETVWVENRPSIPENAANKIQHIAQGDHVINGGRHVAVMMLQAIPDLTAKMQDSHAA